jgi:hypothetical protein
MLSSGVLMKQRYKVAKRLVILPLMAAVAMVTVLGGGAAYAYFLSAGSGSGSASTGAMKAVTVAAVTGTPTTPLVPGGNGDVILKVTNPNNFSVSLTTVVFKAAGTITFDNAHLGCTTTDTTPVVTLSVPANDLPQTIPAAQSATFDLVNAVTMAGTATSNCQGATISIPVTITVHTS